MRAFAVALALATAGCGVGGPSGPLTGRWRGNSGDRFTFVEMNLQQTGGEITGTACEASAGVIFYSGVPVFGERSNLQFTVTGSQVRPCCGALVGSIFRGRQDSSRDIVGTYRGRDIRFGRSEFSVCN